MYFDVRNVLEEALKNLAIEIYKANTGTDTARLIELNQRDF